MALSKKTTILFPPWLHEYLLSLARARGTSLGDLVREACVRQYAQVSRTERVAAAEALRALSLPVADVDSMKSESVPDPADLLP